MCIVQIHYPFVMFGMKTSTKLTAVKIYLINIFLPFFLHKSVNQPQFWSKLKKKKKKNPWFLLLNCQVHKWCHWFWKKTHKITYFQYKKWLWTGIFFTFITVLGMSKISKKHWLWCIVSFWAASDLHFFSLIYCSWLFLPHWLPL